jgi:hypothetical protein
MEAKAAKSRIFAKPVPYALDDFDPSERFITSSASQFVDRSHMGKRVEYRKPTDFKGRPLPYALDGGDLEMRFRTTSRDAFIPRDLSAAKPARVENANFGSRPLPYARDDGVDEIDDALKPKKKENRFTQGRPVPYALDAYVPSEAYTTASGEQYIARDLKEARPAVRLTKDQPFNIVSFQDKEPWANLAMKRHYQ